MQRHDFLAHQLNLLKMCMKSIKCLMENARNTYKTQHQYSIVLLLLVLFNYIIEYIIEYCKSTDRNRVISFGKTSLQNIYTEDIYIY